MTHRRPAGHRPNPIFERDTILRARIGSGELGRGRPMPSESTLMQQYGVTRETARKAVRVLVAEGLVYVEQDRGACVAWRG